MSDNRAEEQNKKHVEEAAKEEKIYLDTIHALQAEERFVNLFKGYNAQSVEQFIKYYAQRKTNWYAHGENTARYFEHKKNKWHKTATEWLREIFMKKLFNLQCRWIAGEMDLPGIETHHDFELWQSNAALQKAAGVITRDEVECYLDFCNWREEAIKTDGNADEKWKKKSDFDEPPVFITMHHFHWFRSMAIDREEDKMPKWFQFYDEQFGTGHLVNLPGTRCDIEVDYHDIWSENIFKKTLTEEQLKDWSHLSRRQRLELKNNPAKRQAHFDEMNRRYEEREASRPKYISMTIYSHAKMKELVELIEPPEVKDLYRTYREWRERGNWDEQIEMALIDLKDADEPIALESNEDYREAINDAYEQYSEKMTRHTLPLIFDEYTDAITHDRPFTWKTNPYETESGSVHELKQRLLAARKWKGEPENFDFLKKDNLPQTP